MSSPATSAKAARRLKIAAIVALSLTVIVGLLALAAPAFVHLLPQRVQVAVGGTITTTPGTVEGMLDVTRVTTDIGVANSHDDVDDEYVAAATIWPWTLPDGWGFPKNRGIADTPGHHHVGMGVQAAFSMWATEVLKDVESGNLTPTEKNHLLDQLEDSYQTLYSAEVLSDPYFGNAIDQLR